MKKNLMKKFIVLLICTLILFNVMACNTINSSNRNTITISQNANGSSGESWSYEFSKEGILEEENYYTSRFFLNIGPGYTENWVFKAVGEGEVTIYWTKYEGGIDVVEEECYEVTYSVDSAGNISIRR